MNDQRYVWLFFVILSVKMFTYFRYFSLRIISFCIQNILFCFKAKQAKLTFFRYFVILLHSFSLSFRFVSLPSDMRGHPTHTVMYLQPKSSLVLTALLRSRRCLEPKPIFWTVGAERRSQEPKLPLLRLLRLHLFGKQNRKTLLLY